MTHHNLPQNWDFFMCHIEGVPASIRTNLALFELAPLEGLSHIMATSPRANTPRCYTFLPKKINRLTKMIGNSILLIKPI